MLEAGKEGGPIEVRRVKRLFIFLGWKLLCLWLRRRCWGPAHLYQVAPPQLQMPALRRRKPEAAFNLWKSSAGYPDSLQTDLSSCKCLQAWMPGPAVPLHRVCGGTSVCKGIPSQDRCFEHLDTWSIHVPEQRRSQQGIVPSGSNRQQRHNPAPLWQDRIRR